MRTFIVIFLSISAAQSLAGQYVQKSFYVPQSVVQGKGGDIATAKKNALQTIPKS